MEKSSNGIFRQKRVNFSQVSNAALHDGNLSLKAKGLYALIQSLITLPNADGLKIWQIRAKCKEGDAAFDNAWRELKTYGYLKQYRIPDNGNRGHFRYEYELLDNPDLSTPAILNLNSGGERCVSERPDTPLPTTKAAASDHTPENRGDGDDDDHTPKNRGGGDGDDHTPKNRGGGDNDHTPGFPPCGKSIECLKHPVENRGGNSNTVFPNTPFYNTEYGNKSVSQSMENPNTVPGTDGQTDEIRRELMNQIDFDWIAETHPDDVSAAGTLLDCMVEMLSAPSTKIRGVEQSRYALKKRLGHVDEEDVVGFLSHMRDRGVIPKDIRNIGAYWKSSFISYLGEQDLTVASI